MDSSIDEKLHSYVWTWVIACPPDTPIASKVDVVRIMVKGTEIFEKSTQTVCSLVPNPDYNGLDLTGALCFKRLVKITKRLLLLDGWFADEEAAREALDEGLAEEVWPDIEYWGNIPTEGRAQLSS